MKNSRDMKGKFFNLPQSELIQVKGGSTNIVTNKSSYLLIKFHITNITGDVVKNYNSMIKSLRLNLNSFVKDNEVFYDRYIMVDDKPETLDETNDGFVTLEINFFNRIRDKNLTIPMLIDSVKLIDEHIKLTKNLEIQKFSHWKQKRLEHASK
jgi:hypothetical protein